MALNLTVGERFMRYLESLQYFEQKIQEDDEWCATGICETLYSDKEWKEEDRVKIINTEFSYIDPSKTFPELIKHKPEDKLVGQYWFETPEERVEVLKKCIQDCESQIFQN